ALGAAGYQDGGPWNQKMHRPWDNYASSSRSWELVPALNSNAYGQNCTSGMIFTRFRDRNQIGRAAS
ncbi:hypothetical protein, partial [Mesorhizobium sp.]|uniref:hypothetical protein n=1 Tax=Mesorhizobium sp. TaxID=1871066 RepID=UPI0025C093C7